MVITSLLQLYPSRERPSPAYPASGERSGCATAPTPQGRAHRPSSDLVPRGLTCSKTWIRRWPGIHHSARSAGRPSCSSGCRPREGAAPLSEPPPPPPCCPRPAPGPPAAPGAAGAEAAQGPSRSQAAAAVALSPPRRGVEAEPAPPSASVAPDVGTSPAQTAAVGRAILRAALSAQEGEGTSEAAAGWRGRARGRARMGAAERPTGRAAPPEPPRPPRLS